METEPSAWLRMTLPYIYYLRDILTPFEGQCVYIWPYKTANTQHIKNWMILFWPMVHRCKKCSDISEVTSGGRAEIENVKNDRPSNWHVHLRQQMLLLKCHCTFYIYGPLGRKAFCQILKRCFISWITSLNVQKLQIFAIFASKVASIVKAWETITHLTFIYLFSMFTTNKPKYLHIFQLCLDMPHQALSLLESTLVSIISNGSLLDYARAQYLWIRCNVAAVKSQDSQSRNKG